MNDFWDTRLIYKAYSGSISYGTNTKDSDVDLRGVCIPPTSYLLGLDTFEQKENKEPDQVIYSLQKFVTLAMSNNPNIIDTLFVAKQHIAFSNEFGQELLKVRDKFISKQVYHTYGGYAFAQLKKMTTVGKEAIGKRADTIAKYGYDTKNAMHLVRLLRMGIEILTEGEVYVMRPDNQELLRIRNGAYTLKEIEDESKRLNNIMQEAYVRSSLPKRPDHEFFNEWLVDMHRRSMSWTQ